MQQDIYFPERPSLQTIENSYAVSSFFLLVGVIIFSVIILVALVSLIRIFVHIRKAKREQANLYVDMELFYRKQLKLLHGKAFLSSFYQYSKLLVQLGRGKNIETIRQHLGYSSEMIHSIHEAINQGKELDYEYEKSIKEILHQHIS